MLTTGNASRTYHIFSCKILHSVLSSFIAFSLTIRVHSPVLNCKWEAPASVSAKPQTHTHPGIEKHIELTAHCLERLIFSYSTPL
jgi:hypothetical protein